MNTANVLSIPASMFGDQEILVYGENRLTYAGIVAAAVVLRPGAQATPEELIEHCRTRLASFKKPEVVRVVPELPRNHLGKVLRKELQAQLAGC